RKLKLFYRTDASAFAQLKEHQLGKRILFTDQKSWSNEQIILAYRSQSQVESAFADMKDHHFLSWEPMFHWTDSKIRVHAFYCVLAWTLASLLRPQFEQGMVGQPCPLGSLVQTKCNRLNTGSWI